MIGIIGFFWSSETSSATLTFHFRTIQSITAPDLTQLGWLSWIERCDHCYDPIRLSKTQPDWREQFWTLFSFPVESNWVVTRKRDHSSRFIPIGFNLSQCQSWPIFKTVDTTGQLQFFCVNTAPIRFNQTQLSRIHSEHAQNCPTDKNWQITLEFQSGRIVSLITAPDSLWSLLWSDSTRPDWSVASIVELDRIRRCDRTFIIRLSTIMHPSKYNSFPVTFFFFSCNFIGVALYLWPFWFPALNQSTRWSYLQVANNVKRVLVR
jgi:hypothetical protein